MVLCWILHGVANTRRLHVYLKTSPVARPTI